jgi:hypothetical protein
LRKKIGETKMTGKQTVDTMPSIWRAAVRLQVRYSWPRETMNSLKQCCQVGIKAYSDRTPIQRVQNGQENCHVARDPVQDIELFVGRKVECGEQCCFKRWEKDEASTVTLKLTLIAIYSLISPTAAAHLSADP